MTITSFLKTVFSIPMLLVYWFCYYFRYELFLLLMQFYANHFSYGQPFVERLIGEAYFSRSYEYNTRASHYFQKSLAFYEKDIELQTDKQAKGREAFLIGGQYECGKGVEVNLKLARHWYEMAIANGYTEAKEGLTRLSNPRTDSENKQKMEPKFCLPPNAR